MVSKLDNFLFALILSALLVIHCSTSTPLENDKLAELIERFDTMQGEILKLQTENVELKADIKELKVSHETRMGILEVANTELTKRFDRMQTKMEEELTKLQAESAEHKTNVKELKDPQSSKGQESETTNEKWATRFDELEAENEKLKLENSQQSEEILQMKSQITTVQSLLLSKLSSYDATNKSSDKDSESSSMREQLATRLGDLEAQNAQQGEDILQMKSQITTVQSLLLTKLASNDATTKSFDKNNGSSSTVMRNPPTSCQELKDGNSLTPMDGIHLLKINNKIQAAFCTFPRTDRHTLVSEELIGHVDVKTKSVHFYVQRNSSFSSNAVIPFQLARLNEGGAFELSSGIFTAPTAGIYHFDFSAHKDKSTTGLSIYVEVNGAGVGGTYTYQSSTGSNDVVSSSASLRLAKGDRVKLHKFNGVLYDDSLHNTHFSGWLVEEELM